MQPFRFPKVSLEENFQTIRAAIKTIAEGHASDVSFEEAYRACYTACLHKKYVEVFAIYEDCTKNIFDSKIISNIIDIFHYAFKTIANAEDLPQFPGLVTLAKAIDIIMQRNTSMMSFESVYRATYDLCQSKHTHLALGLYQFAVQRVRENSHKSDIVQKISALDDIFMYALKTSGRSH